MVVTQLHVGATAGTWISSSARCERWPPRTRCGGADAGDVWTDRPHLGAAGPHVLLEEQRVDGSGPRSPDRSTRRPAIPTCRSVAGQFEVEPRSASTPTAHRTAAASKTPARSRRSDAISLQVPGTIDTLAGGSAPSSGAPQRTSRSSNGRSDSQPATSSSATAATASTRLRTDRASHSSRSYVPFDRARSSGGLASAERTDQ